MTQLTRTASVQLDARVGEEVELPDGVGSVTFKGIARYAAFNVRSRPDQGLGPGLCAPRAGRADGVPVHPAPPGLGQGAAADAEGRTVVEAAGVGPRRRHRDLDRRN